MGRLSELVLLSVLSIAATISLYNLCCNVWCSGKHLKLSVCRDVHEEKVQLSDSTEGWQRGSNPLTLLFILLFGIYRYAGTTLLYIV